MATKTLQSVDDAQAEFVEGGDFAAVGEDILPATDNLHSLGSAEFRWLYVRAGAEVSVGNTIDGSYASLTDGLLRIYDNGQRVGLSPSGFWIADENGLHVYEFTQSRLALKGSAGQQTTEYGLDYIQLQDALGADGFKVTLGAELQILAPALPTADPVVAGQLWNDAGTLKVSAGA